MPGGVGKGWAGWSPQARRCRQVRPAGSAPNHPPRLAAIPGCALQQDVLDAMFGTACLPCFLGNTRCAGAGPCWPRRPATLSDLGLLWRWGATARSGGCRGGAGTLPWRTLATLQHADHPGARSPPCSTLTTLAHARHPAARSPPCPAHPPTPAASAPSGASRCWTAATPSAGSSCGAPRRRRAAAAGAAAAMLRRAAAGAAACPPAAGQLACSSPHTPRRCPARP